MHCRKCKREAWESGNCMIRMNERGVPGIFECKPSCFNDNTFEENLDLALRRETIKVVK